MALRHILSKLYRLTYKIGNSAVNMLHVSRRLHEQELLILELQRSVQGLAEMLGEAHPAYSPPKSEDCASPFISVIMPTRNRCSMLPTAIASLQTQSHVNWELIIVDDGSYDRTEAVIAKLSCADPRIRYIRQEHAGGVAKARNIAISKAIGEIIAYLDDDNAYYPGYLAAVATAYATDRQIECAYAAQLWVESPQRGMVTFDRFCWENLSKQAISIDMNVFSHLKSLTDRLGGHDERLIRHSDWELALRYTFHTTPKRIPVMAVRYDWGSHKRISNSELSDPAIALIREKWPIKQTSTELRVLFVTYDYPQLSESYVHVEIQWLLQQGVHVEVYAERLPVSPGRALVPVHSGDLEKCLSLTRPDVIHVHWLSFALSHASVFNKLENIPVTIKSHGFDYSEKLAKEILRQPWLAHLYIFPNLISPRLSRHHRIRPTQVVLDTSRYIPTKDKNRRLVLRAGACLPTKDIQLFLEVAALRPEYQFKLILSTNTSGYKTADQLLKLNEQLGNPVEILFDQPYERMGELMRTAGIYLHTFGFEHPFGQPISVIEAMACGTVPLLRRHKSTNFYTDNTVLYYETAQDASAILLNMLDWGEDQWRVHAERCINYAHQNHNENAVLTPMLDDWNRLTNRV